MFKPIGINRTINEDVINKRVKENEDSYLATQKYYDFGNAELVVIRECNDNILYIIDGQHCTLEEKISIAIVIIKAPCL